MIRKLALKVGWPLVALAVAFAMWVTFVGSPEIVSSVRVPIQYRNMPSKWEAVSDLPQQVIAEIQGPSAKLRGFTGAYTAAIADLEGVNGSGDYTVNIDPHSLDLPVGVTVVRLWPEQLRLRFERHINANVPVNVRYSAPPSGYHIASADVQPPRLTICGAESRVAKVHAVQTDPLDLSKVQGHKQFQIPAYVEESGVRFVSPPVVEVSVTLEKAVEEGSATDGKTAVRN